MEPYSKIYAKNNDGLHFICNDNMFRQYRQLMYRKEKGRFYQEPELKEVSWMMEEPKIKFLAVIQHLVILNRKEVLLLRYSGYRGKDVEGLWGLPGGHYISGDPTEDLLREVKEETGLSLVGRPCLVKNYVVLFPDGTERYGVFYQYNLRSAGRPVVLLSREHTEYLWAGRDDLNISIISPYQRMIVEETLESNI